MDMMLYITSLCMKYSIMVGVSKAKQDKFSPETLAIVLLCLHQRTERE